MQIKNKKLMLFFGYLLFFLSIFVSTDVVASFGIRPYSAASMTSGGISKMPSPVLEGNVQKWQNYQSCIHLTNQLTSGVAKSLVVNKPKDQLIFQRSSLPFAQSYVPILFESSYQVLVLKAPLTTLNAKAAKLIAKIKYPKSRLDIQSFVLKEKYFFLVARVGAETKILIYTIEDDRLKPFQSYTISGVIKATYLMNENLLILTEKSLTTSDLQHLIKNQGLAPTLLPKLTSSLRYGLEESQIDQAQCKDIVYHFTSERAPSFFSMLNLNLNALDNQPEMRYFLGHIDQIAFSRDYFYLLQNGVSHVFMHTFGIDPKIYQHSVDVLSGQLLTKTSAIAKETALHLVTKQSSGNTKQYHYLPFDERLKIKGSLTLLTTKEEFDQVQIGQASILLQNVVQKKARFRTLTSSANLPEPFIFDSQRDFFMLETLTPLHLHIEERTGIRLSLSNLSSSEELASLSLPQSNLISPPVRNAQQSLLTMLTRENGQMLVRGIQVTKDNQIHQLFARRYAPHLLPNALLEVKVIDKMILLIYPNMLDLFISTQPQQTNLITIH